MSSTTINTENDQNSDVFSPKKHLLTEESERSSLIRVSAFEDKTCKDHFKKLDIVCVDCRIKICASCALFGKHRGHIVRSEEDVLKEISTRAEYLLSMFETIEKNQCYLTDQTHIQTVKDYLQSNLKNVLQEIQNKFSEIENKLHQKREESIKEVQERFTEMEQKCIQFLTEAPKDAIELTEKWKTGAKDKLLVLCENNSDNYSLDLMLDQRKDNSSDIIHQGSELLKSIELANQNLEKQLEEFQFETVYVDFAHNYRNYFDKLISVSSRQDNELSNLLHTKKNTVFQKPFNLSELTLARQSVDVFQERFERKSSTDKDTQDFKYVDGDMIQSILYKGGENLESPNTKNKYKTHQGNGHNNHTNDRNSMTNGNNQNNIQHLRNQSSNQSQNSKNQAFNSISNRKHTPSIFNNDILDDNLLLNNDDINEQFNDSIMMMTKQHFKFNTPNMFVNKIEEFNVNSIDKGHINDTQLLDGIDQELFGKNIELQNNIDVHLKDNRHDANNIGESVLTKKELDNAQKGKVVTTQLNEKFQSILKELQKDSIEQADFTYADMGDDGMNSICDALKHNKNLKGLKLQRNKISDRGASQLLDNILDNQTNISTLYLQDNMISDKFLEYLLQKCKKNQSKPKKLENVHLKNNLLNINKSQKFIEELKKQSVNIYL